MAKRIYSINENYFSTPTLESCYWAGFIAADGCIYDKRINHQCLFLTLSNKDMGHLDLFRRTIGYSGPLRKADTLNKDTGNIGYKKQLQIASHKICMDLLNNFNITPRKTHTLQPPHLEDNQHIGAYIKGFIDGDGYIKLEKQRQGNKYYLCPTLEISDGSTHILEWIQRYINTIITNTTPIEKCQKNAFRYRVRGKKLLPLLKYFKGINTPYLSRKWDQSWILDK